MFFFHVQNGSAAGDDTGGTNDDGGGGGASAAVAAESSPPTLMDRVSGVMDSVKQQAAETLDGAGNAASALTHLRPPSAAEGGGARVTENRLVGGDALDRLQQTKGRAVAAAKRVVDETVHKLTSTMDGIRRTIGGNDADDEGGDRRVSDALDGLFRAVGSESRAAFDYASDVINETADRAKAAVDRAQRQRRPRPQQ